MQFYLALSSGVCVTGDNDDTIVTVDESDTEHDIISSSPMIAADVCNILQSFL